MRANPAAVRAEFAQFRRVKRRCEMFHGRAQTCIATDASGGAVLAEPQHVFILALVMSLAIGISLGLLGGGGSTLTVPVLHYGFGIAAHDAIATSLIVVAATSAVALIAHARRGNVRWSLGVSFGGASMVAAYVGGRFAQHLPGPVLLRGFAIVMAVAGVAMLLRGRSRAATREARRETHPVAVGAIGLVVGLLTGVLGAGGGFLIVPALTLTGLAMHEAVATSLLVIAMNSAAGLAGSITQASIDVPLAATVTAIAVGGSFLGARLGARVSAPALQRGFGWFVITVATLMLAREGA